MTISELGNEPQERHEKFIFQCQFIRVKIYIGSRCVIPPINALGDFRSRKAFHSIIHKKWMEHTSEMYVFVRGLFVFPTIFLAACVSVLLWSYDTLYAIVLFIRCRSIFVTLMCRNCLQKVQQSQNLFTRRARAYSCETRIVSLKKQYKFVVRIGHLP